MTDDRAITGLEVDIASPSILKNLLGSAFQPVLERAFDQPLTIPNRRYRAHIADLPIPVGFWRSVGHSFNGFFQESVVDQVAHYSGKDPLKFPVSRLTKTNISQPARP